jgi:hypothetical protein
MKIALLIFSILLFSCTETYGTEETKIVSAVKEFRAAIEEGNLNNIIDLTAKTVNLSEEQIRDYAHSLVSYHRAGWPGFLIFPETAKVEQDCAVIFTSEKKHRLEDGFYLLKQDEEWKILCMKDGYTNWRQLTIYELTDSQKLRFENLYKYTQQLKKKAKKGMVLQHE